MMGFAMSGVQVSTEDMEDVDLYLQTLGVPARRNINDATVKKESNYSIRLNATFAM